MLVEELCFLQPLVAISGQVLQAPDPYPRLGAFLERSVPYGIPGAFGGQLAQINAERLPSKGPLPASTKYVDMSYLQEGLKELGRR